MTDRIKNQTVRNVEIKAFLKFWREHTNDKQRFGPYELTQGELLQYNINLLQAFLGNREANKIYGADKMRGFEIKIADKQSVKEICKDVWQHPEKYYNLSKDEDEYYDFLKYLWVETEGRTIQLAELVNQSDEVEA